MDSFHATIFALKFKVNFTHILKSGDENTENSQNERMRDLFSRYNLQDKIYNKNSQKWLSPIDWDVIEKITNKEIEESIQYLKMAI